MQISNFTILLVDDEKINLITLQALLQKQGYSVVTASNSKKGLHIARTVKPSLILLDVMMPGDDGFEVCKKLKHDPVTISIPVIFITSLTDHENKIKGLSVGGLDYISKPFQKEEVLMRVKNILRLSYSFQRIIDEQASRLKQVRDAQQAILVEPEEIPCAQFSIIFKPLLDAGGDFYDVFEVANNVCDYFTADISGHDIAASFTTSALKALVRYNSSQILTLEETMCIINRVLQSLLNPEQHITAVYARLDRNNMKLNIVNAAHPPVLMMPKHDKPVWIEGNSDPLGAFESGMFFSEEMSVAYEDRIYFFSDGIIENGKLDRSREKGLDAFLHAALSTRSLPLHKAVREIQKEMLSEGQDADDDLLLLGVDV